ncbi:MAG: DEAD/DEAH box helicase, partial [Treponema sp.]|nr:DEAD/DEAH box helicase [Treponema sp.]
MIENSVFNELPEEIKCNLEKLNITEPSKVQERIIPMILERKSVVFQSETGTGKTFAYLLPILKNIETFRKDNPQDVSVKALVCAPTFELASQINQAAKSVSSTKTALFIGGAPVKRQIETLKEKPEIVIGTPARLVELIRLKKLKVSKLQFVVFDEADRLIKKELIEECQALKAELPENTVSIACSATISKKTQDFFSASSLEILPEEDVLKRNISHWALYAENRDKIEVLRKFLIAENPEKALVFTSRSDQVENIHAKLSFKKIDCMALHAKSDKVSRKAAIDKFRSGKA